MEVRITNLLIAKSGHVISVQWVIIFEWHTKHPSVNYSAIEYVNMIRSPNSIWNMSIPIYDSTYVINFMTISWTKKKGKIVELNICVAAMCDAAKRRRLKEFEEETISISKHYWTVFSLHDPATLILI